MRPLVKNSLYAVIAAAILYAISYFFIDRQLAFALEHLNHHSMFYRGSGYLTQLADPNAWLVMTSFGLLIFAVAYYQRRNTGSENALYFFLTMAVAVILVNGLKFFLGRYRPELLFSQGLYGFHFFSSDYLLNSTPSGHAVRIFAAATALSLIWKRAAVLFFIIAVLVALTRLVLEDHFLSDLLLGCLIGTLAGVWVRALFFNRQSAMK